MRGFQGIKVAIAFGLFLGCGTSNEESACPTNELTILPFSGPAVAATYIECTGGRGDSLCFLPLSIGVGSECEATRITIRPRDTGLSALHLYVTSDKEAAFAWIRGGAMTSRVIRDRMRPAMGGSSWNRGRETPSRVRSA